MTRNRGTKVRPCLVVFLVVLSGVMACGGRATDTRGAVAEWRSETTSDGDVTTVRTLWGSVWRGSARLVEEASIGVDRGEDPYMLGRVRGLVATDSEIYVLDQQVPVIRVYGFDGRHVRDIGGEGDGPAEFRRPDSLSMGPDGRLYVRDVRTARISILSAQGEAVGTMRLETNFATSTQMVMTNDGILYNHERTTPDPETGLRPLAMVPRIGEQEKGEPVFPPDFDFDRAVIVAEREDNMRISNVPFSPALAWALSPLGPVVAGVGSDYRFVVHHDDGRVTVVEKAWEPVPVDPDEAAWRRRSAVQAMREVDPEWTWNGPAIPPYKPAFGQLVPDHSGRVWVTRAGRGVYDPECEGSEDVSCWRSARFVEVFDLEGRYLGTVDTPPQVQFSPRPFIRGELFLAVYIDELGTIMVKRYRLVASE